MRISKRFRPRSFVTLGLALLVFAACSDDEVTGPADDAIDPVQAAAALDAVVDSFFDQNEALQSLDFFAGLFTGAINPSAPEPGRIAGPAFAGLPEFAQRIWTHVRPAGPAARIPVGALGKTFVYNPDAQPPRYEIDPERMGAPANGVRFILYAVDPITETPIQPLTEIGYIDVVDTSSFPTISISLTAFVEGKGTLVDIDVTGTFSETAFTLTTSGFLSDGQQNLNFSFDVAGTPSSVDIDFEFDFGTFTAAVDFSGQLAGEQLVSGDVVATLTDAASQGTIVLSFGFDASGAIAQGSGITLNGETVAIISGDIDDPTVTNAAGDPLSAAELQALEDLLNGIGEIFQLFEGIFALSLFLILLGVI